MSHPDATDFWSDRYRAVGEDFLFGTAPNRFLASQAALLARGRRALSIADGEGRNAVWLAGQGLQVTATELSPVALDKAAKLAAAVRVAVDFIHADALNWDYPEAGFDLVVGVGYMFSRDVDEVARDYPAVRFACVDGPDFDGHAVDFDDLMVRLRRYKEEERVATERWSESCRMRATAVEPIEMPDIG